MRQWAIAIGINQYEHFQPLTCAQHDAQSLCEGLVQTGAIAQERCLLLTDTSPMVAGRPTQPTRKNIEDLWDLLCQQVEPEDGVWFFFSGYGVCHQGQDYLMPADGDPTAIATSGLAIAQILQDMASSAAAFTLVLLDVNRSQSVIDHERIGMATAQAASDVGIATVLSCQPSQFSQEAAVLGQGLFTMAVLEGLRGNRYRTVVELHEFLRDRLPELGDHHERPQQNPFTICPPYRIHQAILPQLFPGKLLIGNSSVGNSSTGNSSVGNPLTVPPDPPSEPQLLPAGAPGCDQSHSPIATPNGVFGSWVWRWGSLALALLCTGILVQTYAPSFQKQVPTPAPEQRG